MADVAERQRRVHLSPMIMNVAVRLPKHSPMFGQLASSANGHQLVGAAHPDFVEARGRLPALTRIQSGFLRMSPG